MAQTGRTDGRTYGASFECGQIRYKLVVDYIHYSFVRRQKRTSHCCSTIGLCSVLRPHQHSIGYMGDGFYRSKDPTNSIKGLKEKAVKENNPPPKKNKTKKTQITHMHTHTK